MSTYTMTVQNKDTGNLHKCIAQDDFFGQHEYGYEIDLNNVVLTQKEFDASWEKVPALASEIFDTSLNQTFKEATEAPSHISYRYTSLRSDRTIAMTVTVSDHCTVDLDAEGYPIGIESF